MMFGFEEESFDINLFNNDYERMYEILNILTSRATGQPANDRAYRELRRYFLDSKYESKLPKVIRLHNTLEVFWGAIKSEYVTYDARRHYLRTEFVDILDCIEKDINDDDGVIYDFFVLTRVGYKGSKYPIEDGATLMRKKDVIWDSKESLRGIVRKMRISYAKTI